MRSRQLGLTMVEVLAAMVIFSAGAVVLFGWISQTAQRLAIVNKEQSELFSELAALEYLRTLNPMRRPTGAENIGEASFSWLSTPVGSEQPTRTSSGTDGIYIVQLYKVQYAVDAVGGGRSERMLWLAGWRQTRSGRVADPFTSGSLPTEAAPVSPITAPAAPPR